MKIVENRKEWRHHTLMRLIEILKFDVETAVKEVEKIEKFVFQDDFIIELTSLEQKKALEELIKSMNSN
ncbi:hypothetical protein B9T31_15045 [Acinetobacter sp. ANC 4558]|uniref:hypothetical protein n=1 Tax=Acinetobacter sp. ANC 4558 TaxID=1977876 RepID=UPI000A349EC1|nr:hypothetical protein [Acinetobacter sp. ANC 4558]OTG81836.1 hypothetical protein B9T31_15045 [Acinetobacter sp. ANC 4558]